MAAPMSPGGATSAFLRMSGTSTGNRLRRYSATTANAAGETSSMRDESVTTSNGGVSAASMSNMRTSARASASDGRPQTIDPQSDSSQHQTTQHGPAQ